MIDKQRLNAFFLLQTALILLPSSFSTLQARNDVDSYERLEMLNQATGQGSSSGSSFQDRVDTIFNIENTSNRAFVALEDSSARVAATSRAQLEEQKFISGLPNVKSNDGNAQRALDMELRKKDPQGVVSTSVVSSVDGTNSGYLKESESLQKAMDQQTELQKQRDKENWDRQFATNATSQENNYSSMNQALANNPFYQAAVSEDQRTFDMDKSVIYSRLLQGGVPEEDAKIVLRESVNPDDLIIKLMQVGVSYGDARDMTQVESPSEN